MKTQDKLRKIGSMALLLLSFRLPHTMKSKFHLTTPKLPIGTCPVCRRGMIIKRKGGYACSYYGSDYSPCDFVLFTKFYEKSKNKLYLMDDGGVGPSW